MPSIGTAYVSPALAERMPWTLKDDVTVFEKRWSDDRDACARETEQRRRDVALAERRDKQRQGGQGQQHRADYRCRHVGAGKRHGDEGAGREGGEHRERKAMVGGDAAKDQQYEEGQEDALLVGLDHGERDQLVGERLLLLADREPYRSERDADAQVVDLEDGLLARAALLIVDGDVEVPAQTPLRS